MWKILIVDDDADTRTTAAHALADLVILGRTVDIHTADSAAAARVLLMQHEYAVVLFDVVMETTHAGLELVNYLRGELENPFTRIILRTGQPGYAPEQTVIRDFNIDDYILKSSQDKARVVTAVTTAIRAYNQIVRARRFGNGIKRALAGSVEMARAHSLRAMASDVCSQTAILNPAWTMRAAVFDSAMDEREYLPVNGYCSALSAGSLAKLHSWDTLESNSGVQMDAVGSNCLVFRLHVTGSHRLAFALEWQSDDAAPDDVSIAILRLTLNASRQAAAEVLLRSQRIGEVLRSVGVLAHEFRTPLGTMMLNLHALEEQIKHAAGASGPQRIERVNTLLGQGRELVRTMQGQIDRALNNTWILTTSDLRVPMRAMDLGPEVVAALKKLFPTQIERKILRVETHGECWVNMERDSLVQIVSNLVSNALRSVADSRNDLAAPLVTVTVSQVEGKRVRLQCKDTGIGLDGEEVARIFEAFYSGSGSPSHGLGLAVVKRSVASTNGEIAVVSEKDNGATFTVHWPQTHPI